LPSKLIKADRGALREAAEVVRRGGLIVYPTDTVYGLGCNPFNQEAVEKIFDVKGRKGKPLPVLASDVEAVKRIAELSDIALRLAEAFWPGPLTLVLPRKPVMPSVLTCGLPSVGVRIPGHGFAIELIRACGGLLVGTSANRSGHPPPRTAQEALEELGELVELIIDGGPTPLGIPSTVLDLTGPEPKLVREGPIKISDILSVLKAVEKP